MWREKLLRILDNLVLPIGLLCLLTGLFWVVDRSFFHKIFYYLVVLPTLLLFLARPRVLNELLSSWIVVAYLLFASYVVLTLCWSTSPVDVLSLAKRPFLVLFLFCLTFELARYRFDLFQKASMAAASFSIAAAAFALMYHWRSEETDRLVGYGAFSNPLLTSHVFGFFLAWWLGVLVSAHKNLQTIALVAIPVLATLLLATGSRTPLFATAVTITWLAVISRNRRAMQTVLVAALLCLAVWQFMPEVLTQRGLSYRTEIWSDVWRQVSARLWLGYGYDAPLTVVLHDLPLTLLDSHNMTLSVLFMGGMVGLALWMALYAAALYESWRWRDDALVQIFSATMLYGLAAGMTEGGSFISRPKEHWFLIWIPLSLLAAAWYRARKHGQASGK